MKYFSYRWVKKTFAFPPPKCKRRKETQWKWSKLTVVVWTPSHHTTLSYTLDCFYSHISLLFRLNMNALKCLQTD